MPMEQRITERLLAYWEQLIKKGPIPLESAVNPDHLEGVWPSCFLINVSENRFRYDYLGDLLVEAYGDDLSGKEISSHLLYPDAPTLFNAIQESLSTQKPVQDEGEFTNKKGLVIRYRSIVLPLAKEAGNPPDYVLGGMRWRGYAGT